MTSSYLLVFLGAFGLLIVSFIIVYAEAYKKTENPVARATGSLCYLLVTKTSRFTVDFNLLKSH